MAGPFLGGESALLSVKAKSHEEKNLVEVRTEEEGFRALAHSAFSRWNIEKKEYFHGQGGARGEPRPAHKITSIKEYWLFRMVLHVR